ncbi:MAG: dihydroorotase [Bacteroidota bacterium]
MSLLLKSALISDFDSPYHHRKCDILIDKGIIFSLEGKTADQIVDLKGKTVCPGWFDLNANFNDPGKEYKEDIQSGSLVAAMGGFTDVQIVSDTTPPIETKTDVEYVKHRSQNGVNLHVSAALSEGLKGENLCEILDLHHAGASSVSDGDYPIWNSKLLLKALQYTSQIGLPIFQNPRDKHLSKNTDMHEGLVSTHLGMRGEPSLSEELTIKRDLDILKYSGGKLHFSRISCANSLELISDAKEKGLDVTTDVAIHHLLFTDESIGQFESNFKSIPPLRTDNDRKALLEGIKSGVVDAICSNHRPQDQESKQLEFDLAEPGAISLQTFYPSLLKIVDSVPFDLLLYCITNGPRKILRHDSITIDKNMPAKLTILDSECEWILNSVSNKSKSVNSPFWNQKLKGKVYGIVNGDFYNFF